MGNSNRVFVSPGVYTSETDLTFVSQSVGVTTLGVVGETLKGPAFEPILITDFDEFKTYFGGTSPLKDGDGNPKYELGYVAKAYLEESNQFFVTRILGKTGYKPEKTFGITTLGGITADTTSGTTATPETGIINMSGSTYYTFLNDKTSTDGTSITEYIDTLTPTNGEWFTIGYIDPDMYSDLVTTNMLTSPIGDYSNKNWSNTFFENLNGSTCDVKAFLFNYVNDVTTGWTITEVTYDGEVNTDYEGRMVLAIRSRGKYLTSGLEMEITDSSNITLTSEDLTTNPLAEFTLNITGTTSGSKEFTCSLDRTSSKFVTKVLGTGVFDKNRSNFPVYTFEEYSYLVANLYEQGEIRGIDTTITTHTVGEDFLTQWDTPGSPVVVSEVRGGEVDDLFEVITVSDGNEANKEIKISIMNINLDSGEFDVIIRDYNDTDDNIVSLEKFSRCSMNPDVAGYIARKIGTADGEYELNSKYIMLKMNDEHPTDAIPAGFKGYITDTLSGSKLGGIKYKTKYNDAGNTVGYNVSGEPVLSNGDKVRKVSLGVSSQIGYDDDMFMYKGKNANTITYGFHLSTNASTIYSDTGNTIPTYQTTDYDLEGNDKGKLENISYRKFTFAVCGGFDGWDIYRDVRTFSDEFIYGKKTYTKNNTDNGGIFDEDTGNSDYYAYLEGIESFSNPEAYDINVFATPGINLFDHSSLTEQAIDMIESDRADSVYIINSADRDTVDEVVDDIDLSGIDSNYSATYWPWVQVRDSDSATQLYIPPTAEVVRNIAKTDNVSYPWFAVAGYSRGLVNSIKARTKLTLSMRDDLYQNRINPIATFRDSGTIIWGNKTLQIKESALDRLNVRRLLLRARKLISAVSVRLLFEQNDEEVRNEFLRLVNPILESIKKERGMQEFSVKVSNDAEDFDSNTLRGKILIRPTRSLEFIDVEFVITPAGASFEDI